MLGAVGESALIEIAEEPHLHFALRVAGESVNPLDYISAATMTVVYDEFAQPTERRRTGGLLPPPHQASPPRQREVAREACGGGSWSAYNSPRPRGG